MAELPKKDVLLTLEGVQKLEKELEHLKLVRRKEVAERIKQAIEFGDITDNSEYEDAKNEQAFIEGRIITLEKALRNAKVVNQEDLNSEEVRIGSKVKLQDMDRDEELQYTIVGSIESDPLGEKKISYESPVGKAVLGQPLGSVIEVEVPAGTLRYKIIEIN